MRAGAKAKGQPKKGATPKPVGGPFSDVALAGKTVAEKVAMARAPDNCIAAECMYFLALSICRYGNQKGARTAPVLEVGG